jgi:hypothetical protein
MALNNIQRDIMVMAFPHALLAAVCFKIHLVKNCKMAWSSTFL